MLAEDGASSKRDCESVCVGRLERVRTLGSLQVSINPSLLYIYIYIYIVLIT